LKLQILCRYYDARPHPADELFFRDERAICFQQSQQEIESARAEFDRNAVGEQLPRSQQDAETAEFKVLAGGDCRELRPLHLGDLCRPLRQL
jgi:hypothetical protein